MMTKFAALFSATLTLSLMNSGSQSEAVRPRGVHPQLTNMYNPGKDFQCLDGSKTIPFDQVNDDYCDCEDGSDEPGTSACPTAKFYCPNAGHQPSIIPSSRVNDGICDCCDGSDEWESPAENPCQNVCDELGAAARIEAERMAQQMQEGFKLRLEMAKVGKTQREQREGEVVEKEKQKTELEGQKAEKEEVKNAAEELEKAALDVYRAEEERVRKEKEEAERQAVEEEAHQFFVRLDKNQNGAVCKEEVKAIPAFDQNDDGVVSDDEAAFLMSGLEEYSRSDFISTGWILMKKFLMPEEELKEEQRIGEGTVKPDDDYPEYQEEADNDYEDTDDLDAIPTTRPPPIEPEAPEEEAVGPQYDEETQRLIDEANKARDAFNEVDRELRDIEREISQLKSLLERDYGPEDEFLSLEDQCFEYTDNEYVYKMCAYDYCSQKPKHGGSETRLGNWESWEGDQYDTMKFSRGQQCWNGPQRSTAVTVVCGVDNKITTVSEPSKCEYVMTFETPAACRKALTKEEILGVHDEL